MMSSEEDPDLGLLEDSKALMNKTSAKTKRVRQRVDAGEPRNSYASIPNFSSRSPASLASLYSHHSATNGYASKMLCELLGTGLRVPSSQNKDQDMIVLDATSNGGMNGSSPVTLGSNPGRMFVNGGGELMYGGRMPESPERCSSGGSAASSNSHLLRDILQQGRKQSGHGRESPGCGGGGEVVSFAGSRPSEKLDDEDSNESKASCRMSSAAGRVSPAIDASSAPSPAGSSPRSSPGIHSTTDSGATWQQSENPLLPPGNSTSLEVKRARVETIVSNMLQGPTPRNNGNGSGMPDPQPPVNGCKKRKLYQPQQHDTANRNPSSTNGEIYDDEDDFGNDGSPLPKRRNTGNSAAGLFTFRQQLRHMQQQLVAMQQQYMEMVDGDSTDEDVPSANNNNNAPPTVNDRPKSADTSDCEDVKPRIDHKEVNGPSSFVDYDNASMYDEQRRLVIDDTKELSVSTNNTPTKLSLQELRQSCIVQPSPCLNVDYEWLKESLKAELSTSLSQVVDAVVSKCVQQRAAQSKMTPTNQESSKDPTLLSQMLDRKSPRTGKVIDRGTRVNGHGGLCGLRTSPYPPDIGTAPKPPFYFPLKPPASVAATAAFLYGSPPQMPSLSQSYSSPASSTPTPQDLPEQTEAMSLVVASKKKRHKVTDTRLNQRGGPSGQLCGMRSADTSQDVSPKYSGMMDNLPSSDSLPPSHIYSHHPPPPPLVPVSLPTTVAIPNPSLNQSELFQHFPYSHHRLSQHFANLEGPDDDGGPPPMGLHHSGPSIHPLLSFHQRGSPDSLHLSHMKQDSGDISDAGDSPATYESGMPMTSTLTPMHLRKAKLMFFFARYPSSAVLKMYFPDIKFNKNNTAQLVKWFSNFREFFYIQMEKYARQAMSEGIKAADDLKVTADSELLRVLNLHYNRNNHIEAPENFRYVVEQTLREFYKALVAGKDAEQSWKKSIYKIIARLDDNVPEYFKSPNFLDTLE
ncbi:homeobox protein prospero isoform X2 [Parasteatoda tepidariorum]|uniref:homeobox protein prospero isoform X2 n=1 Tax=Parasteatoda tepidariorum TaxID=114398 RepID=UPI00077FC239|nr:homeobox protein prospero isoform X2 [Parasteatoda tepidariorum]